MYMNSTLKIFVAVPFAMLSVTASSQDNTQTLTGTVYGPLNETVAEMPIQATNSRTGEYWRARSMEDGAFELSGLSAGTYSISISTPCCAYESYENEDVEILNGAKISLEIHLEEGSSFNTVGDDPGVVAAAVRARQTIPDLPVPRWPDGTPDLSGMWVVGSDPYPQESEPFEWAAKIHAERDANGFIESPHNRCLPGAPPFPGGGTPFMGKIVQKPELIVVLIEDAPGYRQIFTDGRDHPESPNPSWMGHSIGHWDGDVLVVDTVGFNSRGWNSGFPRTENMHMVERYQRTEFGEIALEVTIDDPTVFMKPTIENLPLDLVPQEEIIEYVCENNKWAQPVQ
jgi:hypothetical protein